MNVNAIFNSILGTSLTFGNAMIVVVASLILGLAISLVYMKTHKKEGYSQGFTTSLIMLAPLVALVILLIGNSVARAFSLAGAFALIRFRSAPGDPKDIAYVFFSVVIGLACGMGYIAYGVVFTIILCLVMFILNATNFALSTAKYHNLRIIVPEALNYVGAFDDVFEKFTDKNTLVRVKTTDFGSLFELTYSVVLKNQNSSKEFIDQLRCRNGNLKIALSESECKSEYHF